eukprot:gnl/MRDRNA2_/MRDRNA2_109349_c0_seq1.p1 gnl/MRDRNA2_/MRDRNA2_109349_c0~~gnl/MRDRNA2_/MRDRNA2_109349_c0_seq1.p1  ORF type:complete len:194 (-),score=22.27 gnl/MRDRNA2_/MRDRNA2_109349_c0_seq1:36-617(-)
MAPSTPRCLSAPPGRGQPATAVRVLRNGRPRFATYNPGGRGTQLSRNPGDSFWPGQWAGTPRGGTAKSRPMGAVSQRVHRDSDGFYREPERPWTVPLESARDRRDHHVTLGFTGFQSSGKGHPVGLHLEGAFPHSNHKSSNFASQRQPQRKKFLDKMETGAPWDKGPDPYANMKAPPPASIPPHLPSDGSCYQ